jgi:SUN domain-containing protein 1/2
MAAAANASSSLLEGIGYIADGYIEGLMPYLPDGNSLVLANITGSIGSSDTFIYVTSLPAIVIASIVTEGSQAMNSAGSGISYAFKEGSQIAATGWDTTLMMLGGRTNKVIPQNVAVDYDLLLSRVLDSEKFKATVEQVARLKTEEETLKIQTEINRPIKDKGKDMSLHQDALNKFDIDYKKKLEDIKIDISSQLKETTEQLLKEQLASDESNTAKINEQSVLLTSLKEKYEDLLAQSQKVSSDIRIHHGSVDASQNLLKDEIAKLKLQIQEMEKEQIVLRGNVTSCCKSNDNYHIAVEQYINDLLKSIIHNSTAEHGEKSGLSDFSAWINNYFVAKNELEEKLQALSIDVKSQTMKEASTEMQHIAKEEAQNTAKQIMNTVSEKIKAEYGQRLNDSVVNVTNEMTHLSGLSEEEVSKIVRNALIQYDADKTGMFDYALETAGGSVISTRCTETFVKKTAMYSLFGIPIWYPSNNPRTIIQPGVQPGECWAFKGSQGFVVIQLAGAVVPTRFSMEHIPKSMSPNSNIDSAPKDFVVYGLKTEKDKNPVLLGRYLYDDNKDPLQIFEVEHHSNQAFPFIELDIVSNYGNGNYTCLYRFRVHGVLQHEFEG